jgi:peptide deformylase
MRPRLIKVRAQDLTGESFEFECGGLLARCIQHEVDHLEGFLFVDRLSDEVKATVSGELTAMERRGKKFNFQQDIKA